MAAAVVGVAILSFTLTGDSPGQGAARFMDALARGDVDAVTENSFIDGMDQETLRERWDYTLNVAAPHYRFAWRIINTSNQGPDTASVRLEYVRNLTPGSFEEYFELPMVRRDNRWLVDVRGISREMFPSLPR